MERVHDILLTSIVATPLAFGVALLVLGVVTRVLFGRPGLPARVGQAIGLCGALLTLWLAGLLVVGFDPEASGYQFVEHVRWIPHLGIHWFVGVDGISLLLVGLTAVLVPVALVASVDEIDRSVESYVFFVLALETGLLGAFTALNSFQFYVFWEALAVPMLFLIGVWGGPGRIRAALECLVFTALGSVVMLVALLVLVGLNLEQGGALNFDLVAAPGSDAFALLDTAVATGADAPWWQRQGFLFAAFAFAFAIKVPLVPLHTWLPDAQVEAPTAGSVLLAGVFLKLGAYGFVRFALPLFPVAAAEASGAFFAVAVVGIVYASLLALVQSDLKRLVAYTSVAHLGFIVLGIFARNEQGLSGAVLQMLNHGVTTAALFLCIGFLHARRGTNELSAYGGLAGSMPVLATLFVVAALSSLALPGLNGFVGEFLILLGAFDADPWMASVALLGVLLGACVLVRMMRVVLFGPAEPDDDAAVVDLDWRERGALIALLVPIVWLGVQPNPVLRRIEPTVIATIEEMQRRTRLTERYEKRRAEGRAAADGPRQARVASHAELQP